jgi:hypothetical protein
MDWYYQNALVIHQDDLHLVVNGSGQVDLSILKPPPTAMLTCASLNDTPRIAKSVARGELSDTEIERLCLRIDCTVSPEPGLDMFYLKNPRSSYEDWQALGSYLLGLEEDYGASDWRGWTSRNWGPRWNPLERPSLTRGDEDGYHIVLFETSYDTLSNEFVQALKRHCGHEIAMESAATRGNPPAVYGISAIRGDVIGKGLWQLWQECVVEEDDLVYVSATLREDVVPSDVVEVYRLWDAGTARLGWPKERGLINRERHTR